MAADNAHVTNQYLAMNGEQMRNLMQMMSDTVAATLQQQQQHQARGGGDGRGGERRGQTRMSGKGWGNLEVFGGGEDKWSAWAWKAKVATRAMEPGLARLMEIAESQVGKKLEDI